MRTRQLLVAAAAAAVVMAACSSGDSSDAANDDAPDRARDVAQVRSGGDVATVPVTDAAPPEEVPAAPGGAIGYSPYVFEDDGEQVVTSLVEGPRGQQTRCLEPNLPCSYLDLKALAESGDPAEATKYGGIVQRKTSRSVPASLPVWATA